MGDRKTPTLDYAPAAGADGRVPALERVQVVLLCTPALSIFGPHGEPWQTLTGLLAYSVLLPVGAVVSLRLVRRRPTPLRAILFTVYGLITLSWVIVGVVTAVSWLFQSA